MNFSPLPQSLIAPAQAPVSDGQATQPTPDSVKSTGPSFAAVLEGEVRTEAAGKLTASAVRQQAEAAKGTQESDDDAVDPQTSQAGTEEEGHADLAKQDQKATTSEQVVPEDIAAGDLKQVALTKPGRAAVSDRPARQQIPAHPVSHSLGLIPAEPTKASFPTGQDAPTQAPLVDAMGREIVQTEVRDAAGFITRGEQAKVPGIVPQEKASLSKAPAKSGDPAMPMGSTAVTSDTPHRHPLIHTSDLPESQKAITPAPGIHVSDQVPPTSPRLPTSDDLPDQKQIKTPASGPSDVRPITTAGTPATGIAGAKGVVPPAGVLPAPPGQETLEVQGTLSRGAEVTQPQTPPAKPAQPQMATAAVKEAKADTQVTGTATQTIATSSGAAHKSAPQTGLDTAHKPDQAAMPVLQTDASPRRKRKLAVVSETDAVSLPARKETRQPSAPTPLIATLIGENSIVRNEVSERHRSDPLPMGLSEVSTAPAQTTVTALLTRPDLPQHIARQLAEVVAQMPTRPVDITLNPEELGRVRLSVTASESGVLVNVLAERPDTLDLMRRHIELLGQEFRNLGYSNIAFSFEGQGGDSGNGDRSGDAQTGNGTGAEPDDASQPAGEIHLAAGATSGLDLRL